MRGVGWVDTTTYFFTLYFLTSYGGIFRAMAQINLAPQTQFAAAARRRRRVLYIIAAGVLVVLLLAWLVLFGLRQRAQAHVTAVDESIASLETEITRLGDDVDRVASFEGRLSALETLLDQHVTWTPLLQEFERLLPPAVTLTSLEVSEGGSTIRIGGIAPNLDDIAQLLASLESGSDRQTLFGDVSLQNTFREEQINDEGVVVSAHFVFNIRLTLAQ